MQNYGTYRKKSKRSFMGLIRGLKLFDVVLIAFSVLFCVLFLLAQLSPHIDPNFVGFLALLGLVSPLIYIANILMFLYWVARWKIWFVIPAVAVLVGMFNITLFFRPTVARQYGHNRDKNAIRVISGNVMGFIGFDNKKAQSAFCTTLTELKELDADIMALQEYQTTRKISQSGVDSILDRFHYKAITKVIPSSGGGWGLAILSRYPILKWSAIEFQRESNNSAMWADVVVQRDTIRIFNCHLQTTGINKQDKDFITEDIIAQQNRGGRVNGIASKLIQNYKLRAVQADSIASIIKRTPYKNIVVCGDFNDTPISYVYNTIRSNMRDSFADKGDGRQITYKGLFNIFRIDYVLHTKNIETMEYQTFESANSDHNPVVVELKIKRE